MPLRGKLQLPGDKSISHRALVLAALAEGTSCFKNLSSGLDVRSTLHCLRSLGVEIKLHQTLAHVKGVGLWGLKSPTRALDCGNSGTTLRFLAGLLSHSSFQSTLIGDESLSKRPMRRVADPLRAMGANWELRDENFAPILIKPSRLQGTSLRLDIPSAQVKSALLLASLGIEGQNRLFGQLQSRDHTERLLAHLGAKIKIESDQISLEGGHRLEAQTLFIPGDLSSASFWITAATLIPGSELLLEDVSLNPSRLHFIHTLRKMGAWIEILEQSSAIEPFGTIRIRSAQLQACSIGPEDIPALIDEIPALAMAFTQAHGLSEVTGAAELRYKESNRLQAIALNLESMGVRVDRSENGFRIQGPQPLQGSRIQTFGDHRIAMAFTIASLIAKGPTYLDNTRCVAVSYPQFFEDLEQLTS
ncbi:MAG: 3-phosphoshikimate 1-carboxyvinyltransferase [Myxococcaceae bacterium]|nr:3-phosphoshikimate 1-carboxyvinyltransferase [Myxococcaceae bacterium]MBH2005739.1 3-phosphoshikimate 1-carboxyvinyltransferase [Myxococcaceae bacterium]